MVQSAILKCLNSLARTRRVFGVVVVAGVLASATIGQTVPPPISGFTPIGIAPGAPVGSYPLSGFDNVNLYNGNLNVHLPLLQVGGRGGAGYTMMMGIEVRWLMNKLVQCNETTGVCDTSYGAYPNWWAAIRAGYGPGVLQGRFPWYEEDNNRCTGTTGRIISLARLTFTEPDGTEHELIDVQSDGEPEIYACGPVYWNRGTVFRSDDGTSMTFVSDSPINDGGSLIKGHLMLRDGTRYDIQDGVVTRIRDRNGNVLSFLYEDDPTFPGHLTDKLLEITDSLNRKVHISYHTNTTTDPFDQITFTGFGATRTIKVKYSLLSSALRLGETIKTYEQLFPSPPDATIPDSGTFDREVVSELQLPNVASGFVGRYKFQYNSYSELARIELPTGGAYEYDWAAGSQTLTGGVVPGALEDLNGNQSMGIYRRVTQKRIFKESSIEEGRMKFLETFDQANYSTNVTSEHRGPGSNGALIARDKHYFAGQPGFSQVFGSGANGGPRPTDYSGWREGFEYKTEVLDADTSGTVLRRVENSFEPRRFVWTNNGQSNDSHLIETVTTTSDPTLQTPLVSKHSAIDPVTQQIGFDGFNNPTDVWEYDFGQNSPGPLTRHTHTDYVRRNPDPGGPNYQNNLDIHIRSLPKQMSVFDASGVELSRTSYEYDNFTAGLATCPGITGHDDAVYTTGYVYRGNPTAITKWVLPSTQLTTRMQYDIAGNAISITDPKNNPPTVLEFSDAYGYPDGNARGNELPLPTELPSNVHTYAFATKVTNALNQIVYAQFDYYTGRPINTEDANGVITKGFYNDLLDRPKLVVSAVGISSLERQTTFDYDDAGRTITTHSDQVSSGDGILTTTAVYDGLGRTNETRTSDPQGTVFTKQEFDALGRVSRVFNPFRTTSDDTYGTTVTSYDALSRITAVQTFDRFDASTGIMSTAYDGARVLVTDQAGKQRISKSDGLGRLTDVWEVRSVDAVSGTEAVTFPNHSEVVAGYRTTYTYDPLDDLAKATQGGQSRFFAYDSLKRLIRARNPEQNINMNLTPALTDPLTGNSQWCVKYVYDANSNLSSKVDARDITTTYTYDALNRVTTRLYSNDPQSTPPVNYFYDSLPGGAPPAFNPGFSIGRLVAVTYSGTSAGTYRGYDQLGRVVRQVQQTDDIDYPVEAAYNLAGAMTSETYPGVTGDTNRRVVNFNYDGAGRMNSLSTNSPFYAPSTASVTGISYAPHGALTSETYGSTPSLVHAMTYNNRLQPSEIKLGPSAAPLLRLQYDYGQTDNNGNVHSITQFVDAGSDRTQIYSYDELNRLSRARERLNADVRWTQTYGYDRFGNRTSLDNTGELPSQTPIPVDPATNRLLGLPYDAAGNLSQYNGQNCFYDAENRMAAYGTSVRRRTVYQYDGEGQRVFTRFWGPQSGSGFTQVYDIAGRLIAEYTEDAFTSKTTLTKENVYGPSGLVATIEPDTGTRYLTADHLGTPRVVTNASAGVVSRHDYLAFGDDLSVGIGGRTTGMGYGAVDGIRQKFTQKERDAESGLDYFLARYYSSAQGRFTGVDPSRGSVNLTNPQSWNRYSYALNNPLAYVDRNGKWPERIHNLIIDRAFGGLHADDRNILKRVSKEVDGVLNGGQSQKNSYKHGMSAPYQTVAEAAKQASDYISLNKFAASNEQNLHTMVRRQVGFSQKALEAFGRALHTITDMTSPTHEGFQVWYGVPIPGTSSFTADAASAIAHSAGEAQISPERLGLAIGASLRLFEDTFGAKALSEATGGVVFGSENDPSVQGIHAQYSLPGSDPSKEAEDLYLYRHGLQRGQQVDWRVQ